MSFVYTSSGARWQSDAPTTTAVRAKAATTPYDGSSQGRRAINWNVTKSGPKTVQYGNLEILRDRIHDAARNNPYAKNAVTTWRAEAIGTGIRPQSLHPKKGVRKAIQELFDAWCEESEINQLQSWYGQQGTAFGTIVQSGEIFGRFVLNNRKDTVLPLTFQLLDPDQMPTWFTDASLGIRSGIQFDEDGRITNYHFFKEHPYDVMYFPNAWERTIIPAADIVHCYHVERVGDIRGTPWLTSVIKRLHELERYDDAELARKASTAMAAGFIRKNAADQDGPAGSEQMPLDFNGSSSSANAGTANVQWEPGSISVLLPGEEMQFFTPPADVAYDPYMTTQLHACAAGCDLAYHQLANDLRKANYSSLRAGLVAFRRKCEQYQYLMFVFQFCRRVWRRVIKEAVICGKLDLPGFEKNPYPYLAAKWITPGWDWVDPLKDVQATVFAIQAGLTSRKAEASARGEDVEQIDRDNQEDNKRARSLGLAYSSVPAEVLGRGESPGVDEPQQPDDSEETGTADGKQKKE